MQHASLGVGIVEGFYGRPFDFEERARLLALLAEQGLSLYLLAPKDGPRHRTRWTEPLSPAEREELGELVLLGESLGVRVAYGLAPETWWPGGERWLSRDPDARVWSLFDARIRELASLGLDTLVLQFDDTWSTLLPARFGRGEVHARAADRARALLAETAGERAFVGVVPAVYHRRAQHLDHAARRYLAEFAEAAPGVPLAWTGPRIFSRWIDATELRSLGAVIGSSPWLWSNAVANDWAPLATGATLGFAGREKLSFGPIENLAAEALALAAGAVVNAAREPTLFGVSIVCLGELARLGRSYDPRAAHTRALRRVFGSGDAARIGAELYELVARHPLSAPERVEAARTHELVRAELGARGSPTALDDELARLETLGSRARTAIDSARLLGEISGTLEVVRLRAASARAALASERASASGDREEAMGAARRSRTLLREARASRWLVGLESLEALTLRAESRCRSLPSR
jgi:hyaluronoglucosaminidase